MPYSASQIRKAIAAAASAVVAVALVFGTDVNATVEQAALVLDQLLGIALVFGLANEDAPVE